jgi:predicted metalloprotease
MEVKMDASTKTGLWRTLGIVIMLFLVGTYSISSCNEPKPKEPASSVVSPSGGSPPVTAPAPTTPITQDEGPLLDDQWRERKVLNDADGLRPLLDAYWSQELLRIYNIEFISPAKLEFYRSNGNPPCGSQSLPGIRNAYWCGVPGDYKVAFDLDWFKSLLVGHPGGASTFYILGHEWGHAVQTAWMENFPGNDKWDPPRMRELNADCLSGVFLHDMIKAKKIIMEEDDAQAILDTIFSDGMGGPWLSPGDHGSKAARQTAFEDGWTLGTDSCRVRY